jgi:hypothetical protein
MWGKGKPWQTEAKFWAWMRGGLRRSLWLRHPVKLELLRKERFRAPLGQAGREVWCCVCAICKDIKRQSDCQVDHQHPAGKLSGIEDISPFIQRLAFVEEKDLRILCVDCHRICSYAERYGLTFDEAHARKKEIAKKKKGKT